MDTKYEDTSRWDAPEEEISDDELEAMRHRADHDCKCQREYASDELSTD